MTPTQELMRLADDAKFSLDEYETRQCNRSDVLAAIDSLRDFAIATLTHSQGESEPPQARGAVAQYTALERYEALVEAGEITDPVEKLRAFCSLAMNGQDWCDSAPFFDALAALPLPGEAVAWQCRKGTDVWGPPFTQARLVDHFRGDGFEVRALGVLAHPAAPGQAQTEEGR